MKFTTALKKKGFSLIELMIVVGIIGVLATMAAPKLKTFQARAKQSEGKMILNQIYTLQESYSLENNKYVGYGDSTTVYGANLTATGNNCAAAAAQNAALGFSVVPCNDNSPRYGYNIDTGAGVGYLATAITGTGAFNKVNPGCTSADSMTMSGDHTFQQTAAMDSTKAAGC